jgi:hypothetical protein
MKPAQSIADEIIELQKKVDDMREKLMADILRHNDITRARITTANARINKLTDRICQLKELQKETPWIPPKCTLPDDKECNAHVGESCMNAFQCAPSGKE